MGGKDASPTIRLLYSLIIIIIAEMAVCNVAGYLIEERRRWPVITASEIVWWA